jgi:hypothetical protein
MKFKATYPALLPFLRKAVLKILFILLPYFGISQQFIEVGGTITENTSWTSENIYLVIDNVLVPEGIELTIGAGTFVRFNQGRSLNVVSGRLIVAGTVADSVYFLPNHFGFENWNWNGVSVISVNEPGSVVIEYASIKGAVVAIRSVAANHMSIRHSSMANNRNIGISLVNSSHCLFEHNDVSGNFYGMEIYASNPGNFSAHNVIRNNRFNNEATNLLLHNDNHGACPFNTIEGNLVMGGLNGLWLSNSTHGGSGHATVNRNIIINNGSENDGYGLYLSMDSTVASNNIFWQNTTAVDINLSFKSHFLNNSIYQNRTGMSIRNNSREISILNNTFTGNQANVVEFWAHRDNILNQNNIFNNEQDSAIVRNQTFANINVKDNFWGTGSDSIIQRLLFDKKDNPILGFLFYEPFLFEPDTVAPVSPPHQLISQLINGSVRLSWHPNPEANHAGYRVYYGDFSDYSFSQASDVIADTMFVLHEADINDIFAVTALNNSAGQTGAQLPGHESPFAFATPFPYAGADTTVCADLTSLSIQNSTLPPLSDSIFWETSGDGTFDNALLLKPVYFPGENDFQAGSVKLRLNVKSGSNLKSHAFNLFFEPSPLVVAGENAIISPDSVFNTTDAFAANYDHILWETEGDGIFLQPDSLNTVYIPGSQDILNGSVLVVLNAFSAYCGMVSDTLKLVIREHFTVEGQVWAGAQLLPGSPVLAIMINEDADLPGRTLTFTNEQGKFRFNQIFSGEYLFYACADTAAFSGFIPAYHAERLRWHQAYLHDIQGNTHEIDIRLPSIEVHLPEGQGTISGRFLLPEQSYFCLQAYCTPWFGENNEDLCNGGLSNVSILLYSLSRQKVYHHTLTDAKGKFNFGSLPYGTYILEAEIADYESAVSAELVIGPQMETITEILLQIETEKIISITVPKKVLYPSGLHVFPNPARDYISISSSWLSNEQNYQVIIYDLPGSEIKRITTSPSGSYIRFETRELNKGIYLGKISDGFENHFFRFIRN